MVKFFHYLANVNVCIIVFYLFYYVILHQVKLFTANRIYLLTALLFAFVIPLLDPRRLFVQEVNYPSVLNNLSLTGYVSDEFMNIEIPAHSFNGFQILLWIYLLGVMIILTRIVFQVFRIITLIKTNLIYKLSGGYIVLMNKSLTPFSFLNYIFIDRAKFNEAYLSSPVIQHEQVHSRELHSLDLLTAELVSALLWFNPFVFFLRNSIRENHEFFADYKVIKQGVDPVCYMVQLAREVFDNHLVGLTSNFNYSFTKKRLLMITKIDSSKRHMYRYLFILPVLALMLAFTKPVGNHHRLLIKTITSNETLNYSVSPSIMPIKKSQVVTSSGFGWRVHPITKIKQFHNGIDLKADEGSPVMATAAGVVVKCEFLQEGKGYGRVIIIKHDETFSTLYSQLSAFKVKINDPVKQGDVIGWVGHSGLSTGSHLHYEVIKNNKNVDPKDYFGN